MGVIWFVVYLVFLVAPIVAIIDIVPRDASQFAESGETRATWLVALGVTLVLCGFIGSGLGVYYFVAVRPKLVAPT